MKILPVFVRRFVLLALLLVATPAFAQDFNRNQPCVPTPGGPPCPPTTGGTVEPRMGTPGVIRTPTFGSQRGAPGLQQGPVTGTPEQELARLQELLAAPLERPRRNEFQEFVSHSVGYTLPMFGHNLFSGVPSTFAPVDNIPVTPDYVIGPGDEILIRAWGQVDVDHRAAVDRNGMINIPQVGNVTVAGIRYQSLEGYLKNAIGRIFRNFDLSVTLGQLRAVQVFVVGHAKRPGSYTVSSLSTVVNAIFAAGGPAATGSMRSIQLKRGNQVVTDFDLYDLLIRGDKSKDKQLLPGDVIYFSPVGGLVAIAGSVNGPAIYELKARITLDHLIDLAGGLTTTAEARNVTVERIDERKMRSVAEFNFDKAGLAREIKDGDLVRVYALSPKFDNAVTLRGSVANPGRYPWRDGMRIRDIIPDKEALITRDYWRQQNRVADAGASERQQFRDPARAERDTRFEGGALERRQFRDPARAERDTRFEGGALERQQFRDPERGERDTRFEGGALTRQQPRGTERGERATLATTGDEQRIRVEVKRTYDEINWEYALVERLNYDDLTTMLIPFNLGRAILENDHPNNIPLKPGDVVTIFSKEDIQVPVAKQTKFVRLEGEVVIPGIYQILPGETLRQLVARIGGLTPNAYLFGAEFTRESTREFQQKRLDEAINFLEREIERNLAGSAAVSLSKEEADNAKIQGEGQRLLAAKLRQVRASGRVVLELPSERPQMKDLPDLVLEDGDRFVVPSVPSTVGVVGSVYNQNAFIYRSGQRVSDYLARAGGPTRDADTGSLYVVRADGSVISRRQGGWFFDNFQGERLTPGDTIVVPESLEKFRLSKELKDWSQIFYQFALGVAGLKVLRDL